jgi:sterol desaturase/sphingolipid hydroxylase (fatty acid hydroxylase superfamily)
MFAPAVMFLLMLSTLGAVLLLECRRPARDRQALLSTGLCHDLWWCLSIYGGLYLALLLPLHSAWARAAYEQYFSFLRVDSLRALPPYLQAAIAILLSDFLGWFSHFVRHKVPLFWAFHSVHHAQPELNAFTAFKVHPMDMVISRTLTVVPFLSIEPAAGFASLLGWTAFTKCHTTFVHGNLRLNLGIMKHVLISPQAHRIHHSVLRKHWDVNFGVTFSVWDRMFGTHYPGTDEYPATGIDDARFPREHASLSSLALTPIRQLYYPFAYAWLILRASRHVRLTSAGAKAWAARVTIRVARSWRGQARAPDAHDLTRNP